MLANLLASIPFTIMATGALVGIAASLLGTFLVLRQSSMLSDAISHSIVFGIIVVWLITKQQSGAVQIIGAALTGVLTVVLTEALAASRRVKYDAAIGLVFPVLFSIGVLLMNLYARDVHIDEHTVLLGEIGFVWLNTFDVGDLRIPRALVWMLVMTFVNALFVVGFYKELKLATFDAGLAKALGFAPLALFYGLLSLTSASAVAAFDSVGAVLFITFIIVPPAAAYLLTDRLWKMMVYGGLIALASSISGYYLAVAWNVSIGGMMAVMTGVFLVLAFLFGPRYGLLAQELKRYEQREANATRALAVHLYHHEGGPEQVEENVVSALRDHLRWNDSKVRHALARSLDDGLINRQGDALELTTKGRMVAKEIFEPWGSA
ncbi:MAG: metal ABC transporter permease [Deinococcota bacterium]